MSKLSENVKLKYPLLVLDYFENEGEIVVRKGGCAELGEIVEWVRATSTAIWTQNLKIAGFHDL